MDLHFTPSAILDRTIFCCCQLASFDTYARCHFERVVLTLPPTRVAPRLPPVVTVDGK